MPSSASCDINTFSFLVSETSTAQCLHLVVGSKTETWKLGLNNPKWQGKEIFNPARNPSDLTLVVNSQCKHLGRIRRCGFVKVGVAFFQELCCWDWGWWLKLSKSQTRQSPLFSLLPADQDVTFSETVRRLCLSASRHSEPSETVSKPTMTLFYASCFVHIVSQQQDSN